VVPSLGLVVLAGLSVVDVIDQPLYMTVLTAVMMRPYGTPFIDIAQMPGVVDCWRHGIDPYVTASCDLLDRPFAYSPLWLRAGFLATGPDAVPWLGLGLASAFFLSLVLLPPPRRRGGLLLLALAAFSSLPVFALERGNIDVAMFLLIVTGGWLCFRDGSARMVGYSLVLLAGLLKFYPLVLCLLVLRERFLRAVLLAMAALIVLVLFVWHFQAELAEMAGNLPSLGYFTDTFGARQLPIGLGVILRDLGIDRLPLLGEVDSKRSLVLVMIVLIASHLAASAIAFRLAMLPGMRAALGALTAREGGFLVIGAALLCGCFFAGQNVGYRGIHLLFVVPGLAALALAPAAGAMRTLFRWLTVLVMLLLWGLSLQQLVAWLSGGSARPMGGSVAMDFYWIGHELAWWWVVSVLLAIVIRFVVDAPFWRALKS
jgi:hypothetical protein